MKIQILCNIGCEGVANQKKTEDIRIETSLSDIRSDVFFRERIEKSNLIKSTVSLSSIT